MQYRIKESANGNYKVQHKRNMFNAWETLTQFATLAEAENWIADIKLLERQPMRRARM